MSSAPGIPAATFAESDVLDGRGFAAVYAYVGLGNWRQRLTLAAAIVVPLFLFWCATSHEHRFLLNSLVQEGFVDGKAWRIVGVSFVGDPMVWGYSILVPFLVAVLGVAAQRTLNLVNTASAKATPAWRSDTSGTGFAQAVRETCQIWSVEPAGHPKIRIILRVAPWILAVAMLAYNALTCGLHDVAFLQYPYTSAHVSLIAIEPAVNALAPPANPTVHPPVQSPNETHFDGREVSLVPAVTIKSSTRELQQPIPLRKWAFGRSSDPHQEAESQYLRPFKAKITAQFQAYALTILQEEVETAAEFVYMVSQLIFIESRIRLPIERTTFATFCRSFLCN